MTVGTTAADGALGTLGKGAAGTETTSPIGQMISRAQQLYSLPTVAMEVLQLTSNENANVAQIKDCIQRDPAMTVKILKVVNSPLFGLSGEVSDLNQALALLGIKPLKLLVLGFSLPKEMLQGIEAEVLAQYWQFSLTKAVAAREIALLQGEKYGDETFIAGLLSELGALVLLQDLGDAYANFAAKVLQEGADLSEMEWSALGFDHAILGCRLLQSWNLPESLIQVIREGHPSSGVAFEKLSGQSTTLRLAHNLAEVLVHHRLDLMPRFLDQLTHTTQHEEGTVEHLVLGIQEKLYQLASVLSVSLPEGVNYGDVVSAAYLQLSQIAESVAAPLAVGTREINERVVGSAEGKSLVDSMQQFVQSGMTAPVKKVEAAPAENAQVRQPIVGNTELFAEIAACMQHCRDQRRDFSLALLGINDFEDFVMIAGLDEVEVVRRVVAAIVDRLSDGYGRVLACGDSGIAVLLEYHDRHQTVSIARQILEMLPVWSQRRGAQQGIDLSVSCGVASACVPPKSLPPKEIFQAALRCLSAASNGGGNSVKSIELL
ncbi:HDOD domain-containing protein [Blastopirellula marina]|uniref:HDOD domain-containing protein n=1 Tax=Blastopirellula marina TaxID=124 RepID=UPI0011B0D025|nr:HDOD domain-containing protein [Blastopirellula marina]